MKKNKARLTAYIEHKKLKQSIEDELETAAQRRALADIQRFAALMFIFLLLAAITYFWEYIAW